VRCTRETALAAPAPPRLRIADLARLAAARPRPVLNPATARQPVCVLGAAAAQRMGIDRIWPGQRIWAGNMWFSVVGILKPAARPPTSTPPC
jgi:hypothetical protein